MNSLCTTTSTSSSSNSSSGGQNQIGLDFISFQTNYQLFQSKINQTSNTEKYAYCQGKLFDTFKVIYLNKDNFLPLFNFVMDDISTLFIRKPLEKGKAHSKWANPIAQTLVLIVHLYTVSLTQKTIADYRDQNKKLLIREFNSDEQLKYLQQTKQELKKLETEVNIQTSRISTRLKHTITKTIAFFSILLIDSLIPILTTLEIPRGSILIKNILVILEGLKEINKNEEIITTQKERKASLKLTIKTKNQGTLLAIDDTKKKELARKINVSFEIKNLNEMETSTAENTIVSTFAAFGIVNEEHDLDQIKKYFIDKTNDVNDEKTSYLTSLAEKSIKNALESEKELIQYFSELIIRKIKNEEKTVQYECIENYAKITLSTAILTLYSLSFFSGIAGYALFGTTLLWTNRAVVIQKYDLIKNYRFGKIIYLLNSRVKIKPVDYFFITLKIVVKTQIEPNQYSLKNAFIYLKITGIQSFLIPAEEVLLKLNLLTFHVTLYLKSSLLGIKSQYTFEAEPKYQKIIRKFTERIDDNNTAIEKYRQEITDLKLQDVTEDISFEKIDGLFSTMLPTNLFSKETHKLFKQFGIKLKNLKSKEDLKGELRKVLSNPLPIQPNTI